MLRITDAYMGKTHVTSEDVGFYNIGQFGYETGYFELKDINSSEEFETEILSGNKVRIKQGMGIVGGRRFRNDGFLDITLDSGATGENRIDAIVLVRSQDAEGIESIKTEIWKGAPSSGTPSVPQGVYSTGPVPDVAADYVAPFFLVTFNGVNIVNVEKHPDFNKIRSIEQINTDLQKMVVSGGTKGATVLATQQSPAFTNGDASLNLSGIAAAYGKSVKYAMAQFLSASSIAVTSTTVSSNTVKVKARLLSDGSAYTGTTQMLLIVFMA